MDLSKTMVCPKCGNVVAVTDQFCSKCFERLKRPSFWQRLGAWFQPAIKSGPPPRTLVIGKSLSFQSITKQGEPNACQSLDDMPPEIRAALANAEVELKRESDAGLPAESSVVSGDTPRPITVVRKDFQVYKFKDAAGREQVFHSLDEMPPDVRAEFEKFGPEEAADLRAAFESKSVVSKDASRPHLTIRRDILFKFKDATGKEQVYHSLDEMPPETRAIFEKMRGQLDLPQNP